MVELVYTLRLQDGVTIVARAASLESASEEQALREGTYIYDADGLEIAGARSLVTVERGDGVGRRDRFG